MTQLTSARAAKLADCVYRVQNDPDYERFISSTPEFEKPDSSNPSRNSVHRIQVTRGFCMLNVNGYFAVCAKETGKWESHRFIRIRSVENVPDWKSTVRAGNVDFGGRS